VAKAAGAGVQSFIPKPYSAEAVLQMLRQVLDEDDQKLARPDRAQSTCVARSAVGRGQNETARIPPCEGNSRGPGRHDAT
jgi:DNA-binding NtrC family response regulator